MRWAVTTLLVALAAACTRRAPLPQGPQPYLIVRVSDIENKLVTAGTIAPDIAFEYSGESRDHQDGFEFYGTLAEKSSSGFRIRWHAAQRRGGEALHDSTTEVFAPWGAEMQLPSLGDYRVSVFYAPKTADEYFTREDFTK